MMLKKVGLVAAIAAAGMVFFGGMASATESHSAHGLREQARYSAGDNDMAGQVGLVNLNNLDLLHNVNVVPGICGNNINVLGVQVPIQHVADGLNIPILSPGNSAADGGASSCASGAINDGGTYQAN
jgi:hypothetical protein